MEIGQQISYTSHMSKQLADQPQSLKVIPDADLAILCRDIREEMHLTQKQIAELVGVTETTYANWEHNRTQPTGQAIYKLLKLRETNSKKIANAPAKSF